MKSVTSKALTKIAPYVIPLTGIAPVPVVMATSPIASVYETVRGTRSNIAEVEQVWFGSTYGTESITGRDLLGLLCAGGTSNRNVSMVAASAESHYYDDVEYDDFQNVDLDQHRTWREVAGSVTYGSGLPMPTWDPSDEEFWS